MLILEATTLGELLISCSCLVLRRLAYFMSSPLNPAAFLCGGRQHLTFAPTATNITKDLLPVFAVLESAVIYEIWHGKEDKWEIIPVVSHVTVDFPF